MAAASARSASVEIVPPSTSSRYQSSARPVATIAAPTLNSVELEAGEAEALFREALRNVDLMLSHDLIHGDLSAYNMLYWEGEITIIDFPQVVSLHSNPRARMILERDILRTCEYFAAQGVDNDPEAIAAELWHRHVADIDPEDAAADQSRLELELELELAL
ncbi:MAG: hypothetical protein EHM56_09055 [Chloroflexi bacterium]|nr:MAG: hypothetical protein EHM56_09055 [Chloroflexota bacterium]